MARKPKPNPVPKEVAETLEKAKQSREDLAKQMDENAFAESLREALKAK